MILINKYHVDISTILFLILFNTFDKARDRPDIRNVRGIESTVFITSVLHLFDLSSHVLSGSSFSIETRGYCPIQLLPGCFTIAARIGEILPSVVLSRDVSRVNTGVHLRGCTKRSISFFPSRTHFLSLPLLSSRLSSATDSIVDQQEVGSRVLSSGITHQRRISTITFYRFLRSPSTFHGENC